MASTIAEPDIHHLWQLAVTAAGHAYIPYSQYPVGAALRTPDGHIFTGCNVENAAFPSTICAERTALVKAVSEGHRQFDALVVVTRNGGFPCGTCRQMLFEFAPHLRVVTADLEGTVHGDCSLSELLVGGFGPSYLNR